MGVPVMDDLRSPIESRFLGLRISGGYLFALGTWLTQCMPTPRQWQRASGSATSLTEYAKEIGLCWTRTFPAHAL
jgi:hypothetical protein